MSVPPRHTSLSGVPPAETSFTPTPKQARLLDTLTRATAGQATARHRYLTALAAAHAAKVPIATLARAVGVGRKTIYKHLAPREE